jgi:ATP-dependent Clp protease ATP-binding subunit ClpC
MGVFERYTEGARRVVFFARYEAGRRGSPTISPPHFVCGLIHEKSSPIVASVQLRNRLEGHWQLLPLSADLAIKDDQRDIPLDNDAKKVLAYAAMEADGDGSKRIEPEHLLRGLLCFEHVASEALKAAALDLEAIRNASRVNGALRFWQRVRWQGFLLLRELTWPAILMLFILFIGCLLRFLLLH